MEIEKHCVFCFSVIDESKEYYTCDCDSPHYMYRSCMEKHQINHCPFQQSSFGGPMIETFRTTPTGLVFHQNSCFLDVLLQIFLSSDSNFLKDVLLKRDPLTFDYREENISFCEKGSIYGQYSKRDIIRVFRGLAINLQRDLNNLVAASEHNDQKCTLIRESLAICMRSVFGASTFHSFTPPFVLEKVLRPVYDLFRNQIHNRDIGRDAKELSEIIGWERHALASANAIQAKAIFQKYPFFSFLPSTTNAMDMLVTNILKLSVTDSMAPGSMNEPLDVYDLFCSIFPPLLMKNALYRSPSNIKFVHALNLNSYVDAEDDMTISLKVLSENPLIVFDNYDQYKTLSRANIDMSNQTAKIVNRPLAEHLLIAGEKFALVAVILLEGELIKQGDYAGLFQTTGANHYTAYIRFKRTWYYFDDKGMDGKRAARFKRIGAFPKAVLDVQHKFLPHMFFYSRADFTR